MPYRNCSDSFSPSDSSSVQHWPLMSCGPKHCEKAIIMEWKKIKPLSIILSSHIHPHISLFSLPFVGFKTLLYIASQTKMKRSDLFPKDRILSEFSLQKNTQVTIKGDGLIKISLFYIKITMFLAISSKV